MVETYIISYDPYEDDEPVDERFIPLTQEHFTKIVAENIERVVFKGLSAKGYLRQPDERVLRYVLEIDFNQTREEQEFTFVHEIIHAQRGIIAPTTSSLYGAEEEIVNRLTTSFLGKNREFVSHKFSEARGIGQLPLSL